MSETGTIIEDALRCAVAVSQRRGMTFSEQESLRLLKSFEENLKQPVLRLSIVGEIKSGKSSLLNTLIGRDLLPVGLDEKTATWFQVISIGKQEHESLALPDGSVRPLSDIESMNRSEYEKIVLKVHIDEFAGRIEFFDTPGLSATYAKHREIAAEALANSDAIMLVIDGTQGITRSALEFLAVANLLKLPCYLVINKADQLTDKDRVAVLETNRSTCANAGLDIAGAVVVSATAKPGNEALRNLLIRELMPKAASVKEGALRSRAVRLCGSLLEGLTTYRRTLEFDGARFDDELHKIRSERQKAITEIEKKTDDYIERIRARVRQALSNFSSMTVNLPSEHAKAVLESGNAGVFRDAVDRAWAEEARNLTEDILKIIEGLKTDFDNMMADMKIPQTPPIIDAVDVIAKLAIVVIPHPIWEAIVLALSELLKVIFKPTESRIRKLLYDELQKFISDLRSNLEVTRDRISADIRRYVNDQALPSIREMEALMQNLEDRKKAGALNVAQEKQNLDADVSELEGKVRELGGNAA